MEDLEIIFFFLLSRINMWTNIYCVENCHAHCSTYSQADSGIPQLAQAMYPETHATFASSWIRFLQCTFNVTIRHQVKSPLFLYQTHPATPHRLFFLSNSLCWRSNPGPWARVSTLKLNYTPNLIWAFGGGFIGRNGDMRGLGLIQSLFT